MKRRVYPLAMAVLLAPAGATALDPFSRVLGSVEQGNQFYGQQHFDQALERYEQAEQEVTAEPRIHFNRGAALFKLGRSREAREAFMRASGVESPEMKKRNYYNLGNTFLAEGGYADAISNYRRALELDPDYDDARFNLELAILALKQQQQQQDQESDKEKERQKEDQQQKDKQKDEEKDEQKEQEQEQEQEQDQDQGQDQKDQEKDQEQQQEEQDQQEEQQQGQQEKEQRDQGQQQEEQQDQQEEESKERQGQPEQQPRELPGQLSRAEFRDLLDAMRDSEKPFQMHRFMMPEFRQQQVEKDW